MNLYCIECLMFTKSNKIQVKRKRDGKINLYSRCIGSCLKSLGLLMKKKLEIH